MLLLVMAAAAVIMLAAMPMVVRSLLPPAVWVKGEYVCGASSGGKVKNDPVQRKAHVLSRWRHVVNCEMWRLETSVLPSIEGSGNRERVLCSGDGNLRCLVSG